MGDSKIYVGNLTYSVTENHLRELFSNHGEVKDVVIIKDKFTDRSKGFGFVEMAQALEAESAIAALNNTEFEGRSLRVNKARPKPEGDRDRKRDSFRKRY
jgi:RNA recognition motif-containing protein